MKNLPLYIIATLGIAACLNAQPKISEDEKAIWNTEYRWTQALIKGDAKTRGEIETKNYSLTEPGGDINSREDGIEELTSGRMVYKTLSMHEQSLKLYGSTAIVTGRLAVSVIADGGPLEGVFSFTDTLIKENGVWKKAASHVSQIGATSKLATEPVPREGKWVKRHEGFVKIAATEKCDILFLGDSITDNWRLAGRGAEVLKKHWPTTAIVNLGISGDRTQHVLWRLQNGEIGNLHPKVIMLMIGTNNLGLERDYITSRTTPAEAAEGVKAILALLRSKFPVTKILLLAVFPRSHLPTDDVRLQVNELNKYLVSYADNKSVFYLDIGNGFLTKDGVLEPSIMPDYLHPNAAGYEIWAKAVEGPLAQLAK